MASPFPPLETRMNSCFTSGGLLFSPVELIQRKKKNTFQILITRTTCLFNKILYSGKSIRHHSTKLIRDAKIWASVKKNFLQMLRHYKSPVSLLFSFVFFCSETNVGIFAGGKVGGKQ